MATTCRNMTKEVLFMLPFFISITFFFIQYPNGGEISPIYLISNCLPLACLCLYVALHGIDFSFEYTYSRRILLGLLFSNLVLAFSVYKESHVAVKVLLSMSSMIANILYLCAIGMIRISYKSGLALCMLYLPVAGTYIAFIENNTLGVMFVIYAAFLVLILVRSIFRLKKINNDSTCYCFWSKLCCSMGIMFLELSDLISKCDELMHKIPFSYQITLSLLYSGHLAIALSVIQSYSCPVTNIECLKPIDILKMIRDVVLKNIGHCVTKPKKTDDKKTSVKLRTTKHDRSEKKEINLMNQE